MATATNLVPHKIFLAGRWVDSPDLLTIENPARPGEPAGLTYQATPEQYEEAVEAAVAAFEVTRRLPAYERGRDPAQHQRRDPGAPRGAGPADRARGRQADPRRARRGRPGDPDLPPRAPRRPSGSAASSCRST